MEGEDREARLYAQLLECARRLMRREAPGHTLQPTALVHEAYLRVQAKSSGFTNLALGAKAIRNVLIDHARTKGRRKRGGDWKRCELSESIGLPPGVDLAELGEGLERLALRHPRPVKVVDLRFFAMLSMIEIADTLGVSLRTVNTDWEYAKAVLRSSLTPVT